MQNKAIKSFNDYSSLLSDARHNAIYEKGFKILSPKQMLQWLLIAFALVKVGNTSDNFLNRIHQIIYSLCQAKEIMKKVYNNIMNSVKL